MDALNEELTKLKLITSPSLSSHVYGPIAESNDAAAISSEKGPSQTNNCQQSQYVSILKKSRSNGQCKQMSPDIKNPKKVGPTVPPKPPKNSTISEGNGARCIDSHMHLPSPSSCPLVLHRKQSVPGTNNKVCKVTLDNPAILEQQLEALAHHKMQLEKKGLLQNQGLKLPSVYATPPSESSIPKLSTSSFLSDMKCFNSNASLRTSADNSELSSILYSNLHSASNLPNADGKTSSVYDNIPLNYPEKVVDSSGSNVYHNLNYGNDQVSEHAKVLPPQPLKSLNIAIDESAEFLKNSADDEIPPPSPVSSSYSELHRATDIFSKINVTAALQHRHGLPYNGSNIYSVDGTQTSNLIFPQYNAIPSEGKSIDSINTAAGRHHNYINLNCHEYASFNDSLSSQGSSTYESIYEPINPRPPSQLSMRSNYLMYGQNTNNALKSDVNSGENLSMTAERIMEKDERTIEGTPGNSTLTSKHSFPKEPEEEVLTDFFVHSVKPSNDVDNYGVCVKCNNRVLGENSGCTAMNRVYHISCFTCSQCQINLQGKTFYALEGKPYCEYDYLQTLEKCSICMKPILERILRATGKPYHPQCFTCVICNKTLDGIPFTVDATNQNYCIADFHKKFAPRCCVCKEPIMPEPGQEETVRVVALDRSFHFECYKCEDCGLLLSSEAEGRGCYPLDDHILCKSCNAKRVQMLTNCMKIGL